MSRHIAHRYNFNTIAGGILRLITEPRLFRRYSEYIEPDLIYQNDDAENHKALREIVKIMHILKREDKLDQFSIPFIESQISVRKMDDQQILKIKTHFESWRNDSKIIEAMKDEGSFAAFIDYLKVLQVAKMSSEMYASYQSGDIARTAEVMEQALLNISKLDTSDADSFDVDSFVESMKYAKESSAEQVLYLGLEPFDDHLGAFEPQTLNVFISTTNGGKTQMAHHLISRCVKQKIKCWVGVLEDREKSFGYRLMSCLTGIHIHRLKKEYHQLDQSEKDAVETARQNIKKYVKAEFIYGVDIASIHKVAIDYDMECELKGLTKPLVSIIDYTGHVAHMTAGDGTHNQMRNAFAERKNYALKHNKICFDFAQVNREGSKGSRDDKILTHNDLAGSFNIAQVCDSIISINRSAMDVSDSTSKLHVAKARDGVVGMTVTVKTEFYRARYNMTDWQWHSAPKEIVQAVRSK